jgi:two-component system chemotaxis response regulator CheY
MNKRDLRLLIVDDHMLMRNMIRQYCTEYGVTNLDFSSNGREALEKIESDNFDVILADWNMPEMNGEDLLKEVRANDNYSTTAFMMITAETEKAKILQILNSGATTYLVKPFSQADFHKHLDKVVQWLTERRAG